MPMTKIQVYQDGPGKSEFLEWFAELPPLPHVESADDEAANNPYAKCVAILRRLQNLGCELRRPQADILRDNIWELRWRVKTVQYRILFGFIGKNSALLFLGCTKEKEVPSKLIDKAITMRSNALKNPSKHVVQFGKDSK